MCLGLRLHAAVHGCLLIYLYAKQTQWRTSLSSLKQSHGKPSLRARDTQFMGRLNDLRRFFIARMNHPTPLHDMFLCICQDGGLEPKLSRAH